jgi:aminopeptidase
MNIPIQKLDVPAPDAAQLGKLADIAIRIGLGLTAGQELIVTSPVEGLPLVRQITERAYAQGASLVTTLFSDDQSVLARLQHASDESLDRAPGWLYGGMAEALRQGAARLTLAGDDPALFAGQDPNKVIRSNRARAEASQPVNQLLFSLATNWAVIPCATPAWARAVFPGEAEGIAQRLLWDALFAVTRADTPDPVAAWQAHISGLEARAQKLNQRRYSSLRFRGPGTDLVVGLAHEHIWVGGAASTARGQTCTPNIPSEEIFTAPHKDRVDGTVRCTKPVVYQGTLIDDIEFQFRGGEVVDVRASRGEVVLRKLIDTVAGARRLGEIALVPHSSPIARTGLLFYNTLLDENAASHMALGQVYRKCIRNGERMNAEELNAVGANQSMLHIDLMIGSADIDVDGMTGDGASEAVMRQGEWA